MEIGVKEEGLEQSLEFLFQEIQKNRSNTWDCSLLSKEEETIELKIHILRESMLLKMIGKMVIETKGQGESCTLVQYSSFWLHV